jgi:hypothetical protein
MGSEIITLERNGFKIEFQKTELISLTQLWKMAGSPEGQKPSDWNALKSTKRLITQIAKDHNAVKSGIMEARRGKGSETKAHYKLALEYMGYLSVEFKSWALEQISRVILDPEDFAADILISSHNKDRVERAKKRVLVAATNKETMELATLDGARYSDIHNDRYRGLYQMNASQLRQAAQIKKSETPLDRMSSYDLNLNSLANQMALISGNSSKVLTAANGLRQLHSATVGKELTPTWEEKLLRPSQARAIAFSPDYQGELPI